MTGNRKAVAAALLILAVATGSFLHWRSDRKAEPTPSASGSRKVRRLARPTAPATLPRYELEALVATFEAHPGAVEGIEALRKAAAAGTPAAVEWLAEVAATDPKMGSHAAAALRSIDNPEAAPDLLKLATGTGPVMVRANAAAALATVGGPEDAAPLVPVVTNDREPLRVRQESALALAEIGNASQAEALVETLERSAGSPESEQLRISLVRALAGIGSKESFEALRRHAQRDLSPNERAYVDRVLR